MKLNCYSCNGLQFLLSHHWDETLPCVPLYNVFSYTLNKSSISCQNKNKNNNNKRPPVIRDVQNCAFNLVLKIRVTTLHTHTVITNHPSTTSVKEIIASVLLVSNCSLLGVLLSVVLIHRGTLFLLMNFSISYPIHTMSYTGRYSWTLLYPLQSISCTPSRQIVLTLILIQTLSTITLSFVLSLTTVTCYTEIFQIVKQIGSNRCTICCMFVRISKPLKSVNINSILKSVHRLHRRQKRWGIHSDSVYAANPIIWQLVIALNSQKWFPFAGMDQLHLFFF